MDCRVATCGGAGLKRSDSMINLFSVPYRAPGTTIRVWLLNSIPIGFPGVPGFLGCQVGRARCNQAETRFGSGESYLDHGRRRAGHPREPWRDRSLGILARVRDGHRISAHCVRCLVSTNRGSTQCI